MFPDFSFIRPLFVLAIIGLVAIALTVIVGVPVIGWWLYTHVTVAF